jgi:hypothetical protein
MMIVPLDEDKYFVVLSRGCSKLDFLKAARVRGGSYAEEIMERIYDCLVTYAVDIQEEYQKYYSVEYADLETFLYWKYNVDRGITAKIMDNLKPGDFWGYGDIYSGGDYGIGVFIQRGTGLEMVNHIFDELREANSKNEN